MKQTTQLVLAFTIGVFCGGAAVIILSILALGVGMETAV